MRDLLLSVLPQHDIYEGPDYGFAAEYACRDHAEAIYRWAEEAQMVVIPIRIPLAMAHTWSYSHVDAAQFYEGAEELNAIYEKFKPKTVVVPVDNKAGKYRLLRQIEKAVGVRFPDELLMQPETHGLGKHPWQNEPFVDPVEELPLFSEHYQYVREKK